MTAFTKRKKGKSKREKKKEKRKKRKEKRERKQKAAKKQLLDIATHLKTISDAIDERKLG